MEKRALLLIDVQQGFDEPYWGKRNNPDAEKNIAMLLEKWRMNEQPVIHIQHCSTLPHSPLHPDSPGCAFKELAQPLQHEKHIRKSVNSSFIGTDLEEYLRKQEIQKLVIVGLTTDHCVSTTTRMAGNFGFDVILLSDATATFDRKEHDDTFYTAEEIHRIHLASLNDEFCKVMSTQKLLSQAD